MTSKQRAYLKGLAMNLEPIFQVGKSSVTPEIVNAITECFNRRTYPFPGSAGNRQENCII